jgi:hypothetical protein
VVEAVAEDSEALAAVALVVVVLEEAGKREVLDASCKELIRERGRIGERMIVGI